MKTKEQNARLSAVGFYQMIVLGCVGGLVNELLKCDRNFWLIGISLLLGVFSFVQVLRIYIKVYRKFLNRKK